MPKEGFKSITISEDAYNELHNAYLVVKPALSLMGIHSFSGFISFSVNKLFKDQKVFATFMESMDQQHKEVFEKLRNTNHA